MTILAWLVVSLIALGPITPKVVEMATEEKPTTVCYNQEVKEWMPCDQMKANP